MIFKISGNISSEWMLHIPDWLISFSGVIVSNWLELENTRFLKFLFLFILFFILNIYIYHWLHSMLVIGVQYSLNFRPCMGVRMDLSHVYSCNNSGISFLGPTTYSLIFLFSFYFVWVSQQFDFHFHFILVKNINGILLVLIHIPK